MMFGLVRLDAGSRVLCHNGGLGRMAGMLTKPWPTKWRRLVEGRPQRHVGGQQRPSTMGCRTLPCDEAGRAINGLTVRVHGRAVMVDGRGGGGIS